MLRHFINIVLYLLPPSRLFKLRRLLLKFAKVNISNGVSFCGRSWIYGRGKLSIGPNTWLSPGVVFYTHKEVEIKIGSSCDIGPGVQFIVGSHEIGNKERRAGNGISRKIVIGNGVWIGANSTILDGITIGDGCIVAAGSVVHEKIEDNCLVAGVPARIKRKLDDQ